MTLPRSLGLEVAEQGVSNYLTANPLGLPAQGLVNEKKLHQGRWLLSKAGDWGARWEADFSSPALPHPAPPKGWSLEAGPFFPLSNWKNWPPSLARGWEGKQGGIEPGGASQWLLCPS